MAVSQDMTIERRPDAIDVEFLYAERRNRLSVALRLILLIPQAIVLYFLGIAAVVVAFLGWFGALVMGRLPGWAAEYLTLYLGWNTRYMASYFLLTDAYPPFAFAAPLGYPVRLVVAPGRLSRLAVLFRIVLAIPAYVVVSLAGLGATPVLVVAWVIVVITGRMPRSLFLALAAVLRYYQRFFGYSSLLVTATYPSGLFGEAIPVGGWLPPATATVVEVGATDPSPPSTAAPGASAAWPARPVPLTGGAKKLVALFLALGVVVAAGVVYFYASRLGGNASPRAALASLVTAHDRFASGVSRGEVAVRACGGSANPLTCVEAGDRTLAGVYRSYAGDVAAISFPASASTTADELQASLRREAQVLDNLSSATSIPGYRQRVARSGLAALDQRTTQDQLTLRGLLHQAA